MVGGLLLSQALTLYTTPVIYLYLDRLQHWLAPRRHSMPTLAEKMGSRGGGLTADHSGRPALRRPSMNRSNSMLSIYESNRRMSPMLA